MDNSNTHGNGYGLPDLSAGVKKKKFRFTQLQIKDFIFYVAIAAIPVVQFCVFYIGVNFNMITLAFKQYDPDGGFYYFAAFKQFSTVFFKFSTDASLFRYCLNSLKLFVLSFVFITPFSLLFSYYIYKKNPASGFFRVILFVPAIISPMVMTMIYSFLMDMMIPKFAMLFSDNDVGGLMQTPGLTFWVLFFYNVWAGFGTSTLLYVGAMSNIDVSVIEAAKIDGISPVGEFFYIVFPLVISTFSVFLVTSISAILVNQLGIFNFFGPWASDPNASYITFGYWFFVQVKNASLSSYPLLSAYGLLISVVTIPLVFAVRSLMNRLDPVKEM